MITGIHDEYHQPSDEVELVNYDKMNNLVKLSFLNLWEIANSDEILLKEK